MPPVSGARVAGSRRRPSARSTCSASRGSCRSAPASSPSLETMDGGKPIQESRDVDVPLAAAHFFYYAGWADKLEYAFPGRGTPRPLGRRGPDHPVELPAADGGVEARAGARGRQHRRAEARGDDAAHRAAARRDAAGGRAAARRRQHRHRRGRDRRRARRPPASTRSRSPARPRSARRSSASTAGTRQAPHPRARRQGGEHRLRRRARSTRRSRASINGIFFNQGHVCCAGSRLLVQEAGRRRAARQAARTACRRCASATRSTRTPTSARSTRRPSSTSIAELVAAGVEEGAEIYQSACDLPERGFWFRPTLFTGVSQSHRIAREEIFGPVLSILTFRTVDEAVEKANNTPYGLSPASGPTRARASCTWPRGCAPASSGRTRSTGSIPTSPFGGYKESGFGREGGLHGLEPYLTFEGGSR